MKLKVVLEENEEGGYTIYVPSLPGCISEGDTIEDALKNVKNAIQLYLEPDMKKIPTGKNIQILEIYL